MDAVLWDITWRYAAIDLFITAKDVSAEEFTPMLFNATYVAARSDGSIRTVTAEDISFFVEISSKTVGEIAKRDYQAYFSTGIVWPIIDEVNNILGYDLDSNGHVYPVAINVVIADLMNKYCDQYRGHYEEVRKKSSRNTRDRQPLFPWMTSQA